MSKALSMEIIMEEMMKNYLEMYTLKVLYEFSSEWVSSAKSFKKRWNNYLLIGRQRKLSFHVFHLVFAIHQGATAEEYSVLFALPCHPLIRSPFSQPRHSLNSILLMEKVIKYSKACDSKLLKCAFVCELKDFRWAIIILDPFPFVSFELEMMN